MLPDRPQAKKPHPFYVHPSNWQAFQVFEACQTQWRLVVGMGGVVYQGLDYPAVLSVLDAWGVKKRTKVFEQVRSLEAGALSVLNEREDIPDNATDPR